MKLKEKSPAEALVSRLDALGWHISCAESCTGGLLAARLVDVPNASRVLEASLVTYSNEAKMRYLRVPGGLLSQYGAVSQEVALSMAKGVAAENQAELGIGISGVAGPGGGTVEKPVGMVCFGFSLPGREYACTQHWLGLDRKRVRERSVDFALRKALEFLEETERERSEGKENENGD
ncbi:MAG: CinA family protein, partial [Bacillota bacterium]|nr:CinA family protein [Bacillota bacterium]